MSKNRILDTKMPNDDYSHPGKHDIASKRRFARMLRRQYDARLAQLREQSLVEWQIIPSGEEVAWMKEAERNIVEWFDRHEYEIFMDYARHHRGGWVVRFCQYVCLAKDYVKWPHRFSHWSNRFLDGVLDKIVAAAESGNGRAQHALGFLYEKGYNGVKKQVPWDLTLAWDWYKKSAESGCILGQRAFVRCLRNGRSWKQLFGVEKREMLFGKVKFTNRKEVLSIRSKKTLNWDIDMMREKCLQAQAEDLRESLKWCRLIAERGDIQMCYDLACQLIGGDDSVRDIDQGAKWLQAAAKGGFPKAVSVVSAAGNDMSATRIAVELHISLLLEKSKNRERNRRDGYDGDSLEFEISEAGDRGKFGEAWLLSDRPPGTSVPPPSGRDAMRTPKMQSANPSFAAKLIAYVRDKFGGNAPQVYRAAHVNRKTYSSIISNELRPVSKQTAIAFSLALHLSEAEMSDFLRSAGYALSEFLLEDMIVQACSKAEIYDIQKVNEILMAHSAKPLSC